jgi:hypothetical protein
MLFLRFPVIILSTVFLCGWFRGVPWPWATFTGGWVIFVLFIVPFGIFDRIFVNLVALMKLHCARLYYLFDRDGPSQT